MVASSTVPRKIDRTEGLSNWGGFASFSGVLVQLVISTRRLSMLLPTPLSLTKITEEHPIILVFGEMSHGGAHVGKFDIPTAMRYREVAVMVPFIRHPDCEGPVVFPYRMYADDLRPVFLGNSCYGLRKELATIEWSGARYDVRRGDQRCFGAEGGIRGSWSKQLAHDHELLAVRDLFEMPIVGRRSSGDFVRFFFDWGFERAECCRFVGDIELMLGEGNEFLHLCGERVSGHAVRGLGWRTSAPLALSGR